MARVVAPDDSREREGPAHQEVGVVLPREADAAVHLDVEVGVLEEGRQGERGGDRGGQLELVEIAGGRGSGVPTAAVASSAATSMSAQWCFTAWNMPMGRPNCTRSFA